MSPSAPVDAAARASARADSREADELVAALLRGTATAEHVGSVDRSVLLSAAEAHEVVPLVAERLIAMSGVNDELRLRFARQSHALAAADLARERELRRLLQAYHAAGVEVLVVKGSHLAYSHYPRPDLRSRIDSDLLVARADRDRAAAVLEALGYEAEAKPSGELAATQLLYVLRSNEADVHLVDLHWRLASRQAFAHVLTFDELRGSAVALPLPGASALGPSQAHALLIACMHRIAHHHDEGDRFKWLYDIHLLASALNGEEWRQFVALAAERSIAAVALDGLARSRRWFATQVPAWVLDDPRLTTAAPRERTAAFLQVRSKAHELLDDLRALPSWHSRLRLAREHLLPNALYMREVYAPASRLPLPLLYARRILRGAGDWLRSRSAL
jgi:hypothetical protein